MYDLIIDGGTIVDGTGAPSKIADIAIKDGLIVEVGKVGGAARRTIRAEGALVTPGFIDVHTHYDGEFLWDDQLDPSFSNGVTTVIAGNCGVGFAPVHEEHRDMLIDLMEGVEDIPEAVLQEGLDWRWKTFPEYMDRLDARRYSMDIGMQMTHAPLRMFVMGDRAARHEAATASDLEAMVDHVTEGMNAGALGFSAARFLGHRSTTGAYVPGTFSSDDELIALATAMGRTGRGVFQIVPHGAAGDVMGNPASRSERIAEHDRFVRIAKAAGRPLAYQLLQFDSDPDDWKLMLEASERANAAGIRIRPQTASRAAGALTTLEGYHPFMLRPSYLEVAALPLAERLKALRTAERRTKILSETDVERSLAKDSAEAIVVASFKVRLQNMYLMGPPLDYEPGPERTLIALAKQSGKTLEEHLYDHLTEGDGYQFALDFATNYQHGSLDVVHKMLSSEIVMSSLSDAGAHVRMVCDGALPSFQLKFWARDRVRGPKLPLEYMVQKATSDAAILYDLNDRGVIAPGKRADLNVIDLENLQLGMPRMTFDLPSGAGRLLQKPEGYIATMVSGTVTREHDQDTGERPGRLIRSGRSQRAH